MLGRGFVPRLSGGTLQLSIRCSSVHFGPSRSLPVRVAGAAAVALSPRFASWASVGETRPPSNSETMKLRCSDGMVTSWNVASRHAGETTNLASARLCLPPDIRQQAAASNGSVESKQMGEP